MEESKSEYFSESIWSEIPPSIQESKDIFTEDNDRPFSEACENEPLQLESFDDFHRSASESKSKPRADRKFPPTKVERKVSSFCKNKAARLTADSDKESVSEQPESGTLKTVERKEPNPAKPQKKRRKRRDVIFKKILRECRRFFQTKLTDLTGFISSKKARKDDYMYK